MLKSKSRTKSFVVVMQIASENESDEFYEKLEKRIVARWKNWRFFKKDAIVKILDVRPYRQY